MKKTFLTPEFEVAINNDTCTRCKLCTKSCSFGVLSYSEKLDSIIPTNIKCVACLRCIYDCPTASITVSKSKITYSDHPTFSERIRKNIWKQAETGGILISGVGTDIDYPCYFDRIVVDACQVTNPAIDPLREPIELTTFLGKKPKALAISSSNLDDVTIETEIHPNIRLETPIMFSAMSYGAVSLEVHLALAKVAKELGTLMNSGEGGLHKGLYPYGNHIIVQCASGRFGVHKEYLDVAAGVEIKIGQGAKPGIGGHLPGEKVDEEISKTRYIPVGTDALSPAPHHDIYSIEDLSQLIYALKEATDYQKPVLVKIAAVHNVAAISSGIARAGADGVVLDGFRGGTGAAPNIVKDHLGIPIEIAVAVVDERLRKEGIRNEVSIIASGGIRCAADVVKAIALGADVVGIGTAALIAMGCTACKQCYTGLCPWGICTQRPDLRKRIKVDIAAKNVINLINAWSMEIKEVLGALGMNAIESLRGNRDRLRGIDIPQPYLDILGIKAVGEGY